MNRFEQDYYNDVSSIEKSLKRIADALENSNVTKVDSQVDETFTKEEQEELDTHHDLLHQLVQDLDSNAYNEFCNTHCLRANAAVEVSNYITDLDYDEVLGIISDLEAKSDDQANEDLFTYEPNPNRDKGEPALTEYKDGVPYDDDYDLRCTALVYTAELNSGDFKTKKEAILDYVTNEFGSHGARYTDIIKFAYYLGEPNTFKYNNANRGYYSCAFSDRMGGHLITGGKDQLVKGINKDGDERYFALSFVESVTDYWKRIS